WHANRTAQRVGQGRGDGHVDELPGEPRRAGEVDRAVVRCAPGELGGVLAGSALHEYPLARADHAFADPTRERIYFLLQPGEPRELDLVRGIVAEICGGSPGAPAVDEGEGAVESHLVEKAEARLEVAFGFPGEAHDEIRGDADRG